MDWRLQAVLMVAFTALITQFLVWMFGGRRS